MLQWEWVIEDFTVPQMWYGKVESGIALVLALVSALDRCVGHTSLDPYRGLRAHQRVSEVVYLEGLMLGWLICRALRRLTRCIREKERRSCLKTLPGQTALPRVERHFGKIGF